jgi:demethylmenaquinone methyltransferase/2-methoxy-6-polyprenyl-1,4-benzoquinol methylase
VNSDISDRTAAKNYQSQYVASLFNSIANTYDFLNHALSGGIDFYWRRKALKLLGNPFPENILDVATGTGDFAITAAKAGSKMIYGIDIAEKMLDVGKNKIRNKRLTDKIKLEIGKAEALRFEENYFDAAIVAFGVRNFENLEKGLSEMHRVIKTGAKILVLEFSKPKAFPVKQIYFFYFKRILPLLGKLISHNDEAYNYLPNTVMNFPESNDFLKILNRIGFKETQQRRLTFGIASVYIGIK